MYITGSRGRGEKAGIKRVAGALWEFDGTDMRENGASERTEVQEKEWERRREMAKVEEMHQSVSLLMKPVVLMSHH